ncbi:acyl-CoA dehydrogenase [Nocardia sp. AG03]|uniref:acyl-CoA dehydrogenase n=1 Tax=Nocardia sp. AG03 TaxID=3025312 RepID=UPI0024189F5A|nr:acyl-CoA dehydrogenase [Nocardia sp. AG03]
MNYRAPVEEYAFLLREVIDGRAALSALEDVTLDDITDLLGHAGTLAGEVLAPLNAVGDRVGSNLENGKVASPPGFVDAYKVFADGGWTSIGAPAALGGGGLPLVVTSAVSEMWSGANSAFALCPGLSQGAIAACHAVGDEHIRATYLPPLISGRWTGTMNLTEPQAGTDLASIKTIARPNGDGTWAVTGQKIFITWGDHDLTDNIVHLVLARTPDAPAGSAGLSLFVVPKYLPDSQGEPGTRNSVHTVSLEHKLGIHASPTCVLDYDQATGLLLGQQHQGLAAMFIMMNHSRLGIAVQALGLADRAAQAATAYAAQRVQGPVIGYPKLTPINAHPDVRRLLLSMSSAVTGMRALLVQVSRWLDLAEQGSKPDRELAEFFVPIIKGWFTETSLQITSDAVQVHGGMGFIEETGVAQYYRDARIMPIYEGTTAIQANDLVGRKLLRNNAITALAVLDIITESVAELRDIDHPVAQRVAQRITAGLDAVRASTATMLTRTGSPRDALAAGVPYLLQWGLLAGGWMHARTLRATLGVADDSETARRRITEADFYTAHHLPEVTALASVIEAGEI